MVESHPAPRRRTSSRVRVAVSSAVLLAAASCTSTPPALEAYLEGVAARYDPTHQMVQVERAGPNYHTRIEAGTKVHPTVDSLDYALALLARSNAGDRERAVRIVRKVLTLQETDAQGEYYGIWPWFLEEPVANMAPPDRNWADFCGARLAQLLVDHDSDLPDDIRKKVRVGLQHAARAIHERDVNPGYTNIAIMGSGVAVAAGELLRDEELLQYGREKLEAVLAAVERDTNFREYNSPTYTTVVLWECERTLHLVRDPASRAAAESLRRVAWRTIAESFHPATAQWAGPHSRTYGDLLTRGQVREIAARTGIDIPVHETMRQSKLFPYWTTPAIPCPPDLLPSFVNAADNQPARTLRRTFSRGNGTRAAVVGTTFMNGNATLGSINGACLWNQRRPLIGYLASADGAPTGVLRLRALKDGRDFSAIRVECNQEGSRVLSRFRLLENRGEWHRHLDAPENSTYLARDLRIRFELTAPGCAARPLGPHRFELSTGPHRIVFATAPGEFFDRPIRWELGESAGQVFLDAILHTGSTGTFDFRQKDALRLAAGLELVTAAAGVADVARAPLLWNDERSSSNGGVHRAIHWDGLQLPMTDQGVTTT